MQSDMKHVITEIFDAIPQCDYWFLTSPDWYIFHISIENNGTQRAAFLRNLPMYVSSK